MKLVRVQTRAHGKAHAGSYVYAIHPHFWKSDLAQVQALASPTDVEDNHRILQTTVKGKELGRIAALPGHAHPEGNLDDSGGFGVRRGESQRIHLLRANRDAQQHDAQQDRFGFQRFFLFSIQRSSASAPDPSRRSPSNEGQSRKGTGPHPGFCAPQPTQAPASVLPNVSPKAMVNTNAHKAVPHPSLIMLLSHSHAGRRRAGCVRYCFAEGFLGIVYVLFSR